MRQIHLVMPFMRSHLKDALIAAYRPMNIIWHPIMFQNEVTEFDEPWIFPLVIPMDSKECTVFMPGCFKRNWFIKNEKIIDGDYYVTVDDDDMYEDGIFDAIKQMNDDIVIISMKRGYQIPANTLPIRQYPVWPLLADPHWVKIGMISAQQSFIMGRIFRQHFHNEKSHNWDGELIVRHKEAGEQIGYRIDLFALFNYFEPGRWIKNETEVSIIIPIIRPESAERCIEAIKKNIDLPIDQYEIVTEIDAEGLGCPEMIKKLTEKAKYDLVMFLGDDCIPEKDFMKHALEAMNKIGWGVVGLNTQDIRVDGGNPLAHWLAHKKMLEHIPGGAFFSTEYKHCWGDNELKDIAEELGRWVHTEKSRITHVHPINQSAEYDEGYQKAYTEENQHHDFRTYCNRKRARMQKKYGTKLAIAVPLTNEMIYKYFFFSFVKVITEYMSSLVKKGKSISFDVLMPDFPCSVDAARNNLVNQAMLLGCTHILMMDTDQVYVTTDMIDKLLAHNKPVVGARVHRRYPPFDPLLLRGNIGKLYQVPDDEVQNEDGTFENEVEVTHTGTGCILYDTQIFIDMIPKKWFRTSVDDIGRPIGEDINFCDELKNCKIPITVDCSIDIKHLTLLAVDWGTYKLFSKIMGGKNYGIGKQSGRGL